MISGLNTNYNTYKKNSGLSFKSAAGAKAMGSPSFYNGIKEISSRIFGADFITKGFEWLKKRPIREVVWLDVCTMIAPSFLVNLKQNLVYGLETLGREAIPMFPNPFMPGIVNNLMMKARGYKDLYANSRTIKALNQAWETAGGKAFNIDDPSQDIIKKYVETVFKSTEGLVGKQFKPITGKDLDNLSDDVTDIIINKKNLGDKEYKERLAKAVTKYIDATGAEGSLNVNLGKGLHTCINNLVRDTVSVADQILTKTPYDKLKGELDSLNNYIKKVTALAVGSSIAVGAAVQPTITYVSKLITGKEGFTGYKPEEKTEKKDHIPEKEAAEKEKPEPKSLILGKSLATAGIAAIMLISMGAFGKGKKGLFSKEGLKRFVENLELKGPFAHIDIIRLVYTGILTGRFWAARDETELKVSVLRDYAGFLNWLVLGSVVTKGVAHMMDKSLVNISGPVKDKNPLKTAVNWFNNVSLKTIAEREVMDKGLTSGKKLLKAAKHNGAMIIGLGYAMFALGIGAPKLINKYVINKPREEQIKAGNVYSAGLDRFSRPISFSQLTTDKKDHIFDRFAARMSSQA